MNALIETVWVIIQVAIGYNLVLPVVLYLFYLLAGRKKISVTVKPAEADYAIIVTAYEQTASLPAVVASLLAMQYSNYIIYIVADKCDITSLHFDDERVIVLRPEKVLASNTRSHFYAINRFIRQHDRLTIIDSDNIVTPMYLQELNVFFDAGFLAVQGERKAKNLDTTYASLDAARDIYYHFYDGKVLFGIGSSATLAGSGMAFTVKLYKECLAHQDVTGAGFDKVLQKEIVMRGHRIAFAGNAVVYDEKTSRPEQLVKQRARWINTWFKYSWFGFVLAAKGLAGFNRNRFFFGLILLRPPLFIFLLLSLLFLAVNIFIAPAAAIWWAAGFLLFVAGFAIALVSSATDQRIYRSLKNIPLFVFYQVLSLLKVRKANKHSVATQHYHHTAGNEKAGS
ncbi:glycosyltransferase [Sediminibacterium ginsengisoli]|uniref:Glycosyltransferase, catalytic subunit of cellulose synthase and poly-beta-1,6-N-acetylglucosamine synthase n=1 Tax=Sediminibacterium ginsengisoli TaxID=413434 RepID=A0A1T4RMQ7_9BACT|nr:glycosyltransferase [Sediminibacterium ginsengisoli]SKA17076.1 Glycosyltransferase, catalytic subunit of cellulose synthase and poly-beta-1,6-N-acetylglucosamine synthase [Sediminibacterium ginsengisoli]